MAGFAFMLYSLVKYRDIGPIWEVVLQAGLYDTNHLFTDFYSSERQVTLQN